LLPHLSLPCREKFIIGQVGMSGAYIAGMQCELHWLYLFSA